MAEPKTVYLEPICTKCNIPEDDTIGRMWCDYNRWVGERCLVCRTALPDSPVYEAKAAK